MEEELTDGCHLIGSREGKEHRGVEGRRGGGEEGKNMRSVNPGDHVRLYLRRYLESTSSTK